jgi:hypothetical protein
MHRLHPVNTFRHLPSESSDVADDRDAPDQEHDEPDDARNHADDEAGSVSLLTCHDHPGTSVL